MPDMIHLPVPQAAKQNAAAKSKPAAGAPADDGDAQAFAAVLRGKCAPADEGNTVQAKDGAAADTATNTAADSENQAAAGAAETVPAPAASDPAAMLAALLAAAPRPQAALRVTGNTGANAGNVADSAVTDATGGTTGSTAGSPTGSDTRAWLAQFAGADAKHPGTGRDAAAGVTAPSSGSGAAVREAADPKAGSPAKTDFSELLGNARAETSPMTHTQNSGNDLASSTLAMLAPARELAEAQRAAPPRTATQIESPVGSPFFANEAAQRVTWLAKNGIEHAEIRISPPDMGPIQVSIDMQQNEASISFFVTQTDTRVALEDSLHQLEEMLAESGIALSQASVGQQDAGQGFAGGQSSGSGARGGSRTGPGGNSGPDVAGTAEVRRPMQARGLVDTFA